MGHFAGPRFSSPGWAYANNHGNRFDHDRRVRVVSPFLFDDYGYDYGYYGYDNDCWTSQRVRTRTGWRYHSVWACYEPLIGGRAAQRTAPSARVRRVLARWRWRFGLRLDLASLGKIDRRI